MVALRPVQPLTSNQSRDLFGSDAASAPIVSARNHRSWRLTYLLLLLVFLTNALLHGRSLSNSVDPLQQRRESLHLLLCKTTLLPILHPWPCLDICHAVFSFTISGQIVSWFAGVFARQTDLENTENAQGLVSEAIDGICIGKEFSILCKGIRTRKTNTRSSPGRLW